MNVDYIIVGCGLAGISFCQLLKKNGKSFIVFDDNSQVSSVVAGGLYNPVILKRFTPVWKGDIQIDLSIPMYLEIEQELNIKIDHKIPVYRLFNSVEEQNNWFIAADKPKLSRWLSHEIITNSNKHIKADFGYGEVLETGRIDTSKLIEIYKDELKSKNQFKNEPFSYSELKINQGDLQYQSIKCKNIVFTEGFGIKLNPFFNYLPLKGTKGELLIIHAPDLKIDFVLKSSVFLIPIGDDEYIVGATYNWNDKTNKPTTSAKNELLEKLNSFLNCNYTVLRQMAGIRPTVLDRRPLVGSHHEHQNLYVLNGLGTRGVMIAPYIAEKLYHFIENDIPLDSEIDISRFN